MPVANNCIKSFLDTLMQNRKIIPAWSVIDVDPNHTWFQIHSFHQQARVGMQNAVGLRTDLHVVHGHPR